MQKLCTLDETRTLIGSGEPLLLAGDEALLETLPRGNWIGGTIPYFMTAEGGLQSAEKVFVTQLPNAARATVRTYDQASLPNIAQDHPGHGFTALLLPAFSEIHAAFAREVSGYPNIFDRPLVGWISGVALDDIGKVVPKVFNGLTGTGTVTEGVALHVELAEQDQATVDIVNLFEPGAGPEITFDTSGFSIGNATIAGKSQNLAQYLTDNAIDTKLPLVADYHGAMVNVSIRAVDPVTGQVDFYAPVFPDIAYRIAAPVEDYSTAFASHFATGGPALTFSYNCILNYAYADLEGKSTGRLLGPMTFGEIAFMLLNQTAVYLTVERSS
jgi:Family of unknown function (DUF6976)